MTVGTDKYLQNSICASRASDDHPDLSGAPS